MKRAFFTILFVFLILFPNLVSAQSAVVTTGGSTSSATYQYSCSIGQVAVACNRAVEHTLSEGVLQPLRVVEISKAEARQAFHINIYPNPTTNIVKLESDNLEADTPIRLYSIDGKLLQSSVWTGNTLSFDLMSQNSGVYILQVKDRTFKIIKK